MPFFWNDNDYWERMKSGNINFFKIDIPMYLAALVVWSIFMYDVLNWKELMVLALPSYLMINTLINIFVQRPHFRIPDAYSKRSKTILYAINFVLSCVLFYMILVGIFQYHYVFFNNLACCEFVKNFPNLN